MRILLAHKFYSITGGAEVFYHEVGRVLAENGHEVAWFSCWEESLDTPWIKYFPLPVDHHKGNFIKRVSRFPDMVYNRKAKLSMAKLIADFRPDVIHAFSVYVQLTPSILDAAREAGVPVVLSCNDYKHICPNYKLFHHGNTCEECKGGNYYRALVNRCCHNSLIYSAASMIESYVHDALNIWRKNVSCFLFASEFMATKTEEFWGKEKFRYEMLPNPFDTEKYKLNGPVGNYALYFGRLIDEKGVDVVLKAASLVPDLNIYIVGDGPDRAAIEQMASETENVKFFGPKWGDELNDLLRACRFVVVPSLWHENFPYVIFQAFAAGKPVLGTNRGGIPELVKGGERGWIYDATSAEDLAKGLTQAFQESDESIEAMGRATRRYLDDSFSDAIFYQRLINIYNSVINPIVNTKIN